jgi:hypothetical protein
MCHVPCHVPSARRTEWSLEASIDENAFWHLSMSAFSTDPKNLFSDSPSPPQATKCKHRVKCSVNAYLFELDQIETMN